MADWSAVNEWNFRDPTIKKIREGDGNFALNVKFILLHTIF